MVASAAVHPPLLEVSGVQAGALSINRSFLTLGGMRLKIQGRAAKFLASVFP